MSDDKTLNILDIKLEDNDRIIIQNSVEGGTRRVSIIELLWLVYSKGKKIVYNGKFLSIEDLLKIAKNDFAWIVFAVYSDLKNRGKKVEVIGDNLLLLHRDSKHIEVYVLEENNLIMLNRLVELIELSHRRGREVIFALVDKHGDVTYYSSSPILL